MEIGERGHRRGKREITPKIERYWENEVRTTTETLKRRGRIGSIAKSSRIVDIPFQGEKAASRLTERFVY